jgi:hypothetical protein
MLTQIYEISTREEARQISLDRRARSQQDNGFRDRDHLTEKNQPPHF